MPAANYAGTRLAVHQLPERDVAVHLRFLGQPENPFTQDVAHDLVGPAGDPGPGRVSSSCARPVGLGFALGPGRPGRPGQAAGQSAARRMSSDPPSLATDPSGPGTRPAATAPRIRNPTMSSTQERISRSASSWRTTGSPASPRPRASSSWVAISASGDVFSVLCPAPMATRSFIKVVRATRHPSPGGPEDLVGGDADLSKKTSLKLAPPFICRKGRTVIPGRPCPG